MEHEYQYPQTTEIVVPRFAEPYDDFGFPQIGQTAVEAAQTAVKRENDQLPVFEPQGTSAGSYEGLAA